MTQTPLHSADSCVHCGIPKQAAKGMVQQASGVLVCDVCVAAISAFFAEAERFWKSEPQGLLTQVGPCVAETPK